MLVVSAGNGSHHEPIITDQDAILLLSMLESQEPLWGRLPTVICQLHVPANIKQLSESLFSDVQPSGVTLSSCHGTPRKSAGEEAMSPTPRSLTRREPKKTTKSSTHIRTHLRYASGAIIHRAEFSSLFAAAYYTPGVLDLLKSMCQPPQSPYSSIVWKIPSTPEMDGKTFSDVFEEMVGVDAIPIGLQRQASARNGNSAAIVYTCPDPDAKVNKGDGIYVLASTEWAGNNTKYTASCLHVDAAHGHHGATTTAMGAHSLLPGDPLAAMSDGEAALSGAEEIVRRRDGPLRCPSNHKLKELTTPDEGWACDLCAADDLAAGTVLWGCRKCKWVCCKDCYEANSGLEDEARLPLTSLTTRTAAAQGPSSNINIPSAPGLASTLEAPQKSSSSELEGVNPSRGGHDSSLQIGEGNRSRLLGGSMDLADVKPETSAISIPPAPVSSGADGLLGGLGVLGSGLINFGKT